MNTIKVYQCLCDETRLRILNLLLEGPLCVCHLTDILGIGQPKVSRHLQCLKLAQAVETQRCYNWTIYRLADRRNGLLESNLKCLQDLRREEVQFRKDLKKRDQIMTKILTKENADLPEEIQCIARGDCA